MTALYTPITACRSCGSARLTTVLDLGNLAISDFIPPGQEEHYAPLELVCCEECSLVQLRHTVDRDYLYRDNPYWYKSGVNESMVAALQDVVDDACRRVPLCSDDKVLDLGCNDGTLLSLYPSGPSRYGFEPAAELAAEARKKSGGCIWADYWPPKGELPDQFRVISSIAQFYNVDDVNAYVAAVKKYLARGGVWIVQMQDLGGTTFCNGVDNICHEHVTYWSYSSFRNLLDHHDLLIADASVQDVNGSSMRFVVKHPKDSGSPIGTSTVSLVHFARRAEENRVNTKALLHTLHGQGKTIYGVAASTKFNTLAQYYGIGPDLITAIAERSPEKCGRMTVGTHIPIISEKELYDAKPDYLFCCAWQFFGPFRVRYAALEEAGAKWIVPLPTLQVLGGEPCHQSLAGVHSGKG